MLHNDIHIWDFRISEVDLSKAKTYLNDAELSQSEGFKFERHRNAYVGRRGTLRQLLSQYLDIKPGDVGFQYGPFGKPYLQDESIHFNLSHSQDRVLIAFSDIPLGIDLEHIKRNVEFVRVGHHFFSQEEARVLESAAEHELPGWFYNCWTRKEAFIKARGDGLSYPLNQFVVSMRSGDDVEFLSFNDPSAQRSDWVLEDPGLEREWASALAYRGERRRIIRKSSAEVG